MDGFNPILIGVTLALALGSIGAASLMELRQRAVFFLCALCVMVGIYVGFAIAALDAQPFVNRASLSPLIIESVIALGFIAAGLLAFSAERYWIIGALILGHGAVDLGHLLFDISAGPSWYAFVCVLYDAIVGGFAVIMLSPNAARERGGDASVH